VPTPVLELYDGLKKWGELYALPLSPAKQGAVLAIKREGQAFPKPFLTMMVVEGKLFYDVVGRADGRSTDHTSFSGDAEGKNENSTPETGENVGPGGDVRNDPGVRTGGSGEDAPRKRSEGEGS
jgi:hypothetical protein